MCMFVSFVHFPFTVLAHNSCLYERDNYIFLCGVGSDGGGFVRVAYYYCMVCFIVRSLEQRDRGVGCVVVCVVV